MLNMVSKVVGNNIYINNELVDNIAILVDTKVGILKYGVKDNVEHYYNESINAYKKAGFIDMAHDLQLVDFTNSKLTLEEISTFINYLIGVSANEDNMNKMLNMSEEEIKEKLKELKEYGF